jgi:hypothetical protein
MKLEKVGRKWVIKGNGKGWIYKKRFPTKWKAEVALGVFKEGGRVSDYWSQAKERAKEHPQRIPWRVLEKLEKALEEFKYLEPGCDEIVEYAKDAGYGTVTSAKSENYFGPRLHNTWGEKAGGRVHIDIGCCGYHLMLDQISAKGFVEFIKNKRKTN